MAILLGNAWGSILKLHPHPLLFADPLKVDMFCIFTAWVLGLYIIFSFLIVNQAHHHILQIKFFF